MYVSITKWIDRVDIAVRRTYGEHELCLHFVICHRPLTLHPQCAMAKSKHSGKSKLELFTNEWTDE